MKKGLFFLAITTVLILSCTDEQTQLIEEQKDLNETLKTTSLKDALEIDPIKDCPQNDRNCNGIDDSQE
ncbi:hypothetical protein [Tenacibaculum aiptasiae]|uniref:hypothetical protein n=1 Tax=Tenacibaculum aiptasiae TaxID=426481 RepID=UPI00232D2EC0|nr:hypothetical protein [Tenacibaculum aiptasiae]